MVFPLHSEEYYCEICGAPVRVPRYYEVEGAVVILCERCAKFGKPLRDVRPPKRPRPVIKARPQPSIIPAEPEEEELVPDYGLRIRTARERLGWTQEELAGRLGEPVSYVRRIEAQKVIPPDKLIEKLEKLLNIELRRKPAPVFRISTSQGSTSEDFEITLGDILIIKKPKKKRKC